MAPETRAKARVIGHIEKGTRNLSMVEKERLMALCTEAGVALKDHPDHGIEIKIIKSTDMVGEEAMKEALEFLQKIKEILLPSWKVSCEAW